MASHRRHRSTDVPDLVVAHLPGYQVDSLVRVGEGVDNRAYEVNGELTVRLRQEPDPVRRAALVNDVARLLAAVAGFSPRPVPEPVFTAAEQGCLAYFALPGVPLLDVPRHQRAEHSMSIATSARGPPRRPPPLSN